MKEEFICGDCKGITEFQKGKRGSRLVEFILWSTLVVPGIFYSIWRLREAKKKCYYCGGDFLLPKSLETQEFLQSTKINRNKYD